MTNLQRRLKKLETLLTDPTGLVPHTQKWLEYWERWLEKWATDSSFRPRGTDADRSGACDHRART